MSWVKIRKRIKVDCFGWIKSWKLCKTYSNIYCKDNESVQSNKEQLMNNVGLVRDYSHCTVHYYILLDILVYWLNSILNTTHMILFNRKREKKREAQVQDWWLNMTLTSVTALLWPRPIRHLDRLPQPIRSVQHSRCWILCNWRALLKISIC